MGNADREENDLISLLGRALKGDGAGQFLDGGELNAGGFAGLDDGGMVEAGVGFKLHDLGGGAEVVGEDGEAAGPVAAHFAKGAVGVEVAHGNMGGGAQGGVAEDQEAIRANAVMAVAQGAGKVREVVIGGRAGVAAIDGHEIVSCAVQLPELKSHCLGPSKGLGMELENVPQVNSQVVPSFMKRLLMFAVLLIATAMSSGCISIPFPLPPSDFQEVQVEPGGKAKILLLDIDGAITSGASEDNGLFGVFNSTVNEVAEKLALAEKDKNVKAVVLRIDSPGGGVTASDIVYRLLKEYKKDAGVPVYSSMLDVAASGGYYVAMASDQVYAHPTSITGSIGVLIMVPQLEGLGNKIGVSVIAVKSGENKDMGYPFHDMTEGQRAILQGVIDSMYERFLTVVQEGRPSMQPDRIRELADGRVYTADQAKEEGLVDGVMYLDEVIAKVRQDIGEPNARVIMYRKTFEERYNSVYAQAGQMPASKAVGGNRSNIGLVNIDAGQPFRGVTPRFQYLWVP